MLNNWSGLTKFLSFPRVPIDNNEAERVLKRFMLFRKNPLFYKTLLGAAIDGMLMSLIERRAVSIKSTPGSTCWS